MKSAILFIFINLWVLLPHFGFAQSALTVTGVVHDSTGAVIAGSLGQRQSVGPNQRLFRPRPMTGAGFESEFSTAGAYQINVEAAGFAPYRAEVTVSADAPTANLEIALAISGNRKLSR